MNNLFETGGAGGIGAILGAIVSFLGLKGRINYTEKRLDAMSEKVVYQDSCAATHKGVEKQLELQNNMVQEMRRDIKDVLAEVRR